MNAIGLTTLAAALLCAAPAGAQTMAAIEEMALYQAQGDRLTEAHREATQTKIDQATRALQANDFAAARKYAQAVTRADPKRVEAWLLLGAAQTGLQDWKRARTSYMTAIRIWPGNPQARAGLGVAMARSNDPRATTQLAWFDRQIAVCDGCQQAASLSRFRRDVETAIAGSATGS